MRPGNASLAFFFWKPVNVIHTHGLKKKHIIVSIDKDNLLTKYSTHLK